MPTQQANPDFFVLRRKGNFEVDPDDAQLRARPTWVSAEEHIENIQNEIILDAEPPRPKPY